MEPLLWIKNFRTLTAHPSPFGWTQYPLEWQNTELTIHYTALESFTNPRGTIEGGMVCAMLDDVMGLFAFLANDSKPATTINLTMDFLRPCAVGEVITKCRFIKQGKTVLNLESEAWQNNKMIARSTA